MYFPTALKRTAPGVVSVSTHDYQCKNHRTAQSCEGDTFATLARNF